MNCSRTRLDLRNVCWLDVIRPLILTLLLVCLLGWPQGASPASGKKSTAKKATKASQSGAQKKVDLKGHSAPSSAQGAQPAAQADSNDDDPDLPPGLLGKVDKGTYLRLREEYFATIRGIDLNNPPDPRIRMRAIRTMEQQEQRIQQLRRESAAQGAAAGTIAPFSPPSSTTWTELGPSPIPNGQTSPSVAVSGRVTAIAVHPTNRDLIYVGAAQGGVFRSTDGGASWTAIMDSALSLAVGAIAIAPSQPSTIYVGTGEANFSLDSFFGVGVYRIDNADTSPVLVGPLNKDGIGADVFTGRSISQILVHPTDPNTIFVSTTSGGSGLNGSGFSTLPSRGLYRSTNAAGTAGLVTFTKLTVATANGGDRSTTDIAMEPGNPNNIVAAVFGNAAAGDGGYYRSTNALAGSPTFTQTLQLNTRTLKFGINKVGSTVTVLAGSGDGNGTFRISTDGGATWGTTVTNGYCDGQCFYDAPVAIKPDDANTFFLGGQAGTLTLQKTIDGGTNFTQPNASLHADTHVIVYAPSDFTVMYEGNDGGIWRSADGGNTWTSRNTAGFRATQFESLALHPLDREYMIGGTQDNGTEFRRPDTTWTRADGGDGGYSLIDQNAMDTTNVTLYHTYFNSSGQQIEYAHVTGTANAVPGGWTSSGCFNSASHNGITCADSVLFYAPMALGPGNPNPVYFGSDHLYRSADTGANNVVVSQVPIVTGVAISTIAIAPQDDNVRIVGLQNGKVFATTTGSTTLTDITGPIPARYVARAMIDPNDKNTAYVTLDTYGLAAGQHVWKTTNLNGAPPTWTASGSGIPDVPVNSIVIDPLNSSFVYAATDIGVYFSADGGSSWNPYGTGLPRVACFDIAIQSPNRVLRVATHGRGIWEIATASANGATTTAVLSSPNPSVFGQPVTFTANVTSGSGTPTGTVQFQDGGGNLGSPVALSGGTATLMTSALAVGAHAITAIYNPDSGSFTGSTGSLPTQTVNKANTTTAVVSNNNPSVFGQSVTFTATVTVNSPGAGTPTGTVQFQDGGGNLGAPVTLSGGAASLTTSALNPGSHNITAIYSGDGQFLGSTGSLPTQTVKGTTTTALGSSLNPSTFGQSVTFTATVTANPPAGGTPTGTVQFQDGGNTLGAPVTLSSGTATLMTSALTAGSHSITAIYSGDSQFVGGTGSLPTQTVNKANTTTAVGSSANPSTFPNSVTFTATVTASAPGAGTPGGTVTFKDGSTTLGTGTLVSGAATFTTNALAIGSHSITGVYGGDVDFNSSTSPVLTQTVNGTVGATADISVTVTHLPNKPVFVIGSVLTATVTVTNNDATNDATVALNFNSIPGAIEIDSVSPQAGVSCTNSGSSVQCSIATLAHSSNKTVTITLRPLFSDARTLALTENVTSNTTDANQGNNTASDPIKVRFKPFRQ